MFNSVSILAGCRFSFARLVTTASVLSLALLLPLLAQAQAVGFGGEYQKKIKAAGEIAPFGDGAFGNYTSDATGKTVFETTDIDLPGNDQLPVQLGRRLAIDERFVIEELGGFGNWDVDVPYIEGTFSKSLGWSVAAVNSPNRYKRCSIATPPIVEGLIFSSEEVSHGYSSPAGLA